MLNRRHIRTKVMQVIYALKRSEDLNIASEEKFLSSSMESMYALYLLMLSLLVKVHDRAKDQQEKSQQKHLLTSEDLNPNMKFIKNALLVQLTESVCLKNAFEKHKITNWELDNEYVEVIFKSILESDLFAAYMAAESSSYKKDRKFVVELFKEVIAPNEKLYNYLEDRNLTWIDDLPVVNTALVKLLNKSKEENSETYFTPQLFKDDEDKAFGLSLLKDTIKNLESYTDEISLKTKNWDKDRIADIDFVLLQMAICEFHNFPSIPTKVSINEYIEIAKEYSTPKSNVFINGVLDKIVKEYDENKTLNKIGRGLM
ncbi:transcription antitermination factor NusB [Flavobacteriaceae bacterium]|jgi:N utilization substance protein B|nr:transcription antitermination factor NusB [Flavobacteriaceae bacterium]MDG1383940.1 transcription antitermination factor NusB [Flavobacteriaceae bacterium]